MLPDFLTESMIGTISARPPSYTFIGVLSGRFPCSDWSFSNSATTQIGNYLILRAWICQPYHLRSGVEQASCAMASLIVFAWQSDIQQFT